MATTLLVIGSAGQVGQELAKCVSDEHLILLRHEDVDVSDMRALRCALDGRDYDVLVNLAAFHNVNECEDDVDRAFSVNAVGARNVAEVAKAAGKKVVFFSSDYVFGENGRRRTPYIESDQVEPINVYGVSKCAGEQLVRATTPNHLIVRSASLFGVVTSRKGWTFPEMILGRAEQGQPLRVVDDQYMSPTYTFDLASTVVRLLDQDARGTIHITNDGGCTWFDLATATLELAGLPCPVQAVDSSAFPSKARRPIYSVLASKRLESFDVPPVRHWREALHAYLIEKGVIAA